MPSNFTRSSGQLKLAGVPSRGGSEMPALLALGPQWLSQEGLNSSSNSLEVAVMLFGQG